MPNAIKISETEVLIFGGYGYFSGSVTETYRFNFISQTYTAMPNCVYPAYGSASGLWTLKVKIIKYIFHYVEKQGVLWRKDKLCWDIQISILR